MPDPNAPSSIFQPELIRTEREFYAEYGSDEDTSAPAIRGVGSTPAEAMADFDWRWETQKRDGSRIVVSQPADTQSIAEADARQREDRRQQMAKLSNVEWLAAQGAHVDGVEFSRRFGYPVWQDVDMHLRYNIENSGRTFISLDTAFKVLDKHLPAREMDELWLGGNEEVDIEPFIRRYGQKAWMKLPKKHRNYRAGGEAYVTREAILDRVWEEEQ